MKRGPCSRKKMLAASQHLSQEEWNLLTRNGDAPQRVVSHIAACPQCYWEASRLSLLSRLAEAQRTKLVQELDSMEGQVREAFLREFAEEGNNERARKFPVEVRATKP